MPDFSREARRGGRVAGVDEAGRGPLAGPVAAAAVILVPALLPAALLRAIDDSKRLTAAARLAIAAELRAHAAGGGVTAAVACASTAEILRLNILRATFLAMRRAVARLPLPPAFALIDGNRVPPGLACPGEAVVGGDALSLSIAAASILAKVTRDRVMARLATRHPGYGWERNAGYGTAEHKAAIARLGPTRHHRLGFAPFRPQKLDPESAVFTPSD